MQAVGAVSKAPLRPVLIPKRLGEAAALTTCPDSRRPIDLDTVDESAGPLETGTDSGPAWLTFHHHRGRHFNAPFRRCCVTPPAIKHDGLTHFRIFVRYGYSTISDLAPQLESVVVWPQRQTLVAFLETQQHSPECGALPQIRARRKPV